MFQAFRSPNDSGPLGDSQLNNLHELAKLKDGDAFSLNGQRMKLVLFQADEVSFNPPADVTAEELSQYDQGLIFLGDACQIVQKMSDRLTDPLDGETHKGVEFLAANLDQINHEKLAELSQFLLALCKYGGNVHGTRGCVLVPPVCRSDMESIIASLSSEQPPQIDWKAWLDHIYNPVPSATQGFYLFVKPEDRLRFEELLGDAYRDNKAEINLLFQKALSSDLSQTEWNRYDHLSHELLTAERLVLEERLSTDRDAAALSTRVRIAVDADGNILLDSKHYTAEFARELGKLGLCLEFASKNLPQRSHELKNLLLSLQSWCTTESYNPDWGRAHPAWLKSTDESGLLDVLLMAEETGSRIGSKGQPHIQVSQYAPMPPDIAEVWDEVKDHQRQKGINAVLFRTLMVGGYTNSFTLAGEKLPNPAGQEVYKSMTVSNTIMKAIGAANLSMIGHCTDFDITRAHDAMNALVLAVMFHEYGHTFGAQAEWIGSLASSVEETNAQASNMYLSSQHAGDMFSDISTLLAGWYAVRRTQQGPAESHSHSDITLFHEYLSSGAIAFGSKDGHPYIQIADSSQLVVTAFNVAQKMRLWERGLPSRLHSFCTQDFDPNDDKKETRLQEMATSILKVNDMNTETWRKEVQAEVEAYFSRDRLLDIASKLQPIIDSLDNPVAFSVIPTHRRYHNFLD